MQKRKHSITEAITNTLTGFFISFLIQLVIYPAMSIEVKLTQNILITSVFTVASILRGYVLRRLFNKIK